jgi:4-diphosphocytidyl-2-C-methyl-D-erythritol kinase
MEIGAGFGADVPYCVTGGTALAEGIGEKITALPDAPHCWVVLVCPKISVSTADIFRKFSSPVDANGISAAVEAIHAQDIKKIAAAISNHLTAITASLHPQILPIIETLKDHGALNASMSGSGPSVFGLFHHEHTARAAKHILQHNRNTRVFLTSFASRY